MLARVNSRDSYNLRTLVFVARSQIRPRIGVRCGPCQGGRSENRGFTDELTDQQLEAIKDPAR